MPDIMTECYCLNEIFIQTETAPDRPRNLGDELDVDYPVSNMVVFHEGKNLGFIDIPGVCPGMDDPVRVTGIRCPDVFGFPVVAPYGIGTD